MRHSSIISQYLLSMDFEVSKLLSIMSFFPSSVGDMGDNLLSFHLLLIGDPGGVMKLNRFERIWLYVSDLVFVEFFSLLSTEMFNVGIFMVAQNPRKYCW